MELELNRTHLAGYNTVLDTTVFQEETLETIVPDACPDILRLVDTEVKIILKSKEAMDGRVSVSGTARLSVLYLPDGEGGPCSLEVTIPFTASAEGRQVRPDCMLTVCPRVQSADARAVNPRKVLVRVEAALWVRAFAPEDSMLCTGVTAPPGAVEQLRESRQQCCVAAVQEKPFSFSDDLTIPAGRPEAEKILCSRVSLTCHGAKIIGNKLIFKGEAVVQLLYRAAEGLGTADFTLPFSQIAEVSGVGEEAVCTIEMALAGAEFTLGGDGRTVSVALSLLAQCVVREERTVELLTDAYSTCCTLTAEQHPYHYHTLVGEGVGRQNVRELIETGVAVKSVLDAYALVGQTKQSREGAQLRLSAEVSVTALCIAEDESLCALSRRTEVSCLLDAAQDCRCSFTCVCGNLTATPTADGVEVRFPVDFPYLCLAAGQLTVVHELKVDESAPCDPSSQPSIVLRMLGQGERLWDVAKRYGTTTEDIIIANELADEQPPCGTLLLIPKKR